MKITRIEHVITRGYKLRGDGITEKLSGTIVAMLGRGMVVPMDCDVRLPFCMMGYNMTPKSAIGKVHIPSCTEWTPTSIK